MQGIDIEEVRRAGKPKVEIVISTNKTIRYPTEARTLQQAIDMCVAGASHSALFSTAFRSSRPQQLRHEFMETFV